MITEKSGLSYARNIGLKFCESPLIAFIDDDAVAPSDWVENIISAFQRYPSAGAIGGRVNPIWPTERPGWLKGDLHDCFAILDWGNTDLYLGTDKWLVGANIAYQTHLIKDIGGFDLNLGRNEKLLFAHEELAINISLSKLGYDIVYVPSIYVKHLIQAERINTKWVLKNSLWEGASRALVDSDINQQNLPRLAENLNAEFHNLITKQNLPSDTNSIQTARVEYNKHGQLLASASIMNSKKNRSFSKPKSIWPVFYIVTPCFNSTKTIDQTIQSVISQSGNFSIRYHIQDGGSTDGTVNKLKVWQRMLRDRSIPLSCTNLVFTFSSETDQGMYDAIVKAFNKMSVPNNAFMSWINADDYFYPFSFEHVANVCHHLSSEIHWIGGTPVLMDEELKRSVYLDRILPMPLIRHGLCDGYHWEFIQQEGIFFTNNLWKKALERKVFDGFKYAGDWNLWRIFAEETNFYQIQWPLAAFRKRSGQLSDTYMEEYQNEINLKQNFSIRQKALSELLQKRHLWSYVIEVDEKYRVPFIDIQNKKNQVIEHIHKNFKMDIFSGQKYRVFRKNRFHLILRLLKYTYHFINKLFVIGKLKMEAVVRNLPK